MSQDQKIIIIKKIKKGGHGGHHGGAWKIAYADFVTAMMAFFLLLWLLSTSSKEQLDGISEYFTPTIGLQGGKGVGSAGGINRNIQEGKQESDKGSTSAMDGGSVNGSVFSAPDKLENANNIEEQNFSNILQDLNKVINSNSIKEMQNRVMVDMTPEGLRIQLMDDLERPLFKPNTNDLQTYTKAMLDVIGKMIRKLPHFVSISGHTRKVKEEADSSLGWKLSTDRALTVRDYMISSGMVSEYQISRVVGQSDRDPFNPADPSDIRNIRISIILLKSSIAGINKHAAPKEFLGE